MTTLETTHLPVASTRVPVELVNHETTNIEDFVSVEEPLEIRLAYGPVDARLEQSISITMRTPGNDLELTQGFLFGEGIVHATSDVLGVEHCGPPSPDKGIHNVVRIELSETAQFDPDALLRHTFTSSSCGICGKTSLDAVKAIVPDYKSKGFAVNGRQLKALPEQLLTRQTEFVRTGGLHASASFDSTGQIERIREDVGRHNALDKLVGSYLDSGIDALRERGLLLSGRASFELVQKAAVAGIPLIASIGPPSSLAIELASSHDMTLVGFLKADRFNVYSGGAIEA